MLDIIKKRRSHRKYDDKEITRDDVNKLLTAGLMSPSSKRSCPWEFVVIDNKEKIEELAECKPQGAAPLKGATLAIVILGNSEKSDVWIEDTAIAATLIQLTAESLNLGSCWIQIRERMHNETISANDFIKAKLSIPAQLNVASIISFGHKVEEKAPFNEEKLKKDAVTNNNYSTGYNW